MRRPRCSIKMRGVTKPATGSMEKPVACRRRSLTSRSCGMRSVSRARLNSEGQSFILQHSNLNSGTLANTHGSLIVDNQGNLKLNVPTSKTFEFTIMERNNMTTQK